LCDVLQGLKLKVVWGSWKSKEVKMSQNGNSGLTLLPLRLIFVLSISSNPLSPTRAEI